MRFHIANGRGREFTRVYDSRDHISGSLSATRCARGLPAGTDSVPVLPGGRARVRPLAVTESFEKTSIPRGTRTTRPGDFQKVPPERLYNL
jgi:hypothetical protein